MVMHEHTQKVIKHTFRYIFAKFHLKIFTDEKDKDFSVIALNF